jgi:hypothetical protein
VVFLSLGVSDTRQQNKQEKGEYFLPFFLVHVQNKRSGTR